MGTVVVDAIRVMIVDDNAAVREGLESILSANADITVVATAVNGEEAVDGVATHAPDVVLMDSQMPVMDGVEATRRIKETSPGVKILFLTVHSSHVPDGMEAGADAALLKDVGRHEILSAIRKLAGAS